MGHTEELLALRERPDQPVAMLQTWRDLLFMHQKADPAVLQALLPEGLELDLWEGEAYLGLVTFSMDGIRKPGLPAMPWLSAFPETNVRTYVRYNGRPGVWFFSLDAARWLACQYARRFFSLPYHWAFMKVQREEDRMSYNSDRIGSPKAQLSITANFGTDFQPTEPGTFEFWLVERYLLYASHGGKLFDGQVYHEPYKVAPATILHAKQDLTKAATGLSNKLVHVCCSRGVDVEVFPLRPVQS